MSEERPANVSQRDWDIYQRFLRQQAEKDARKAKQVAAISGPSNQFEYVERDSEAAAAAVLPK